MRFGVSLRGGQGQPRMAGDGLCLGLAPHCGAMEHVPVLVVGAGITGLAFADQLQDCDYQIVEAAEEPGGYCRTVLQDGFVWDYSGHFFHFRHPEIEADLVRRMGPEKVRIVERQSRIHYAGGLIDFPFQKNIHQLPHDEFMACLVDLFERPEGEADNFQDMLVAKFGRAVADKFLIPYNEKLYATDLRRLDVQAMGRFFPYAEPADIVRNFRRANNESYNATFTYPEGGAMQYVHALAQGVEPARLHLNEAVERIDLETRIAHTTRRSLRFDNLISSMPYDRLLRLCGLAADPALFTYNKVLVFNLGFDRKGPEGLHWIYYPQRELSFYRVGFYDNIFETPRMSLYVELGYARDALLDADVIAAARARVLADLERVQVVQGHTLVAEHHVVLDPAYVHITRASQAAVTEGKAVLATAGVYSLGRYGSWTYCSIEDNIVEARTLAALFNRRLSCRE